MVVKSGLVVYPSKTNSKWVDNLNGSSRIIKHLGGSITVNPRDLRLSKNK